MLGSVRTVGEEANIILFSLLMIKCSKVVGGPKGVTALLCIILPWVTQSELQMLLCVTMSQSEPKRPGGGEPVCLGAS